MKWEPIETAPMDGTWILVTGFKQSRFKTISHMYAVAGWFLLTERRPELGGEWYFANKAGMVVKNPTHWMHLPMRPEK